MGIVILHLKSLLIIVPCDVENLLTLRGFATSFLNAV